MRGITGNEDRSVFLRQILGVSWVFSSLSLMKWGIVSRLGCQLPLG